MRRAQVVGLFVLAVVLAGAFRLAVVHQYSSTSPDGNQYYWLSQELVRAQRFAFGPPPASPSHARLPGYPLFLAYVAVRAPMPIAASVRRAALANVALDLATGIFVMLILRELGRPRWAWLVGFACVALCPVLLLFASYSLTEPLATCLGTLAFFLALRARARPLSPSGVACGLVLGAAFLVRADMITLAPALALASWDGAWAPSARAKSTLVMLAAAAVVVAPWGIRNLARFGHPYLAATEWPAQNGDPLPTGPMEWMRTWAAGRPGDGDLSGYFVFKAPFEPEALVRPVMYDSPAERATLISVLNDYRKHGLTPAVDARFVALAHERLRAHPWRVLVELPVRRAIRLWAPPPAGDYPIRVSFLGLPRHRQAIFLGANVLLYALALGGAVVLWRRQRRALVAIAAAIGCRTALHMWAVPTYVCQRYLVEVIPLLIVLAAVMIDECARRARAAWA